MKDSTRELIGVLRWFDRESSESTLFESEAIIRARNADALRYSRRLIERKRHRELMVRGIKLLRSVQDA
jgi:hypothetical protein